MSDAVSTTEVWKAIAGYEGLYSVSNMGRVRRELSRHCRSIRILSPMLTKKGSYQRVALHDRENKKKFFFVARLVAVAFVPLVEGKNQVNHIDGSKANNQDANLEWTTASENMFHRYQILGQKAVNGENHGKHKLTNEQVVDMRACYAAGERITYIAKRFSIANKTASQIIKMKSWKHVIPSS